MSGISVFQFLSEVSGYPVEAEVFGYLPEIHVIDHPHKGLYPGFSELLYPVGVVKDDADIVGYGLESVGFDLLRQH